MRKLFTTAVLLFGVCSTFAQGTINVMAYNLYRFPSATPYNRENALREILVDYLPDLLMVCELESEAGLNKILNTSFGYANATYKASLFEPNTSSDDTLHQAVFYNSEKLILVNQKAHQTKVRDINQYTFVLNTEDVANDSTFIEVFVAHLKSSDSRADRLARDTMVMVFQDVLNQLPSDRAVLFGGDFNFYKSSEEAYRRILDTNNVNVMVDPLGDMTGNWQDNASFAKYHTQATRTSRTGFGIYGATGGLDDRFDFIMMSKNLGNANPTLSYVPNTYGAMGNNGNCLNLKVSDTACYGLYGQTLRTLLHDMSDHLPVIMQLRTNKVFGNTTRTNDVIFEQSWNIIGSNIVEDAVKVRILNDYQGDIYILNSIGQIVKQQALISGSTVYQIDCSDLPTGVYLIRHTNSSKVIRFVKK